jgi:hypothetical protein
MSRMEEPKDKSFTIVPASCSGWHVRRDGRTVRQERKPLLFGTSEQAEEYVREQGASSETDESKE